MKIEKRKVTESSKLSGIAKSAAASALGMATLFSLSACIESDPVSAYDGPKSSSSGTTDSAKYTDFSNSSVSPENSHSTESSSSATTANSSSDNLSSTSSSSATQPNLPRIPMSSSMLAGVAMTSSSLSIEDIIKMKRSSSSSQESAEPQSSSSFAEPESSSSSKKQFPITRDSLTVPNIHLCEDPGCPGVLIDSMVTTFEITDFQA